MSEAHQPLHPEIIPRLDPDYRKFHDEVLQYIVPPHTLPWDPALRNAPAVPGGSLPLEVASTKDYELSHCMVRVFSPKGDAPANGWPVFIFFHGGT
jgi:acetyl esterase/lipase